MKSRPSVAVAITGIIRTTDDGILVRLPSGKARWIPRAHAGFAPGHVILPSWLAAKLRERSPTGKEQTP